MSSLFRKNGNKRKRPTTAASTPNIDVDNDDTANVSIAIDSSAAAESPTAKPRSSLLPSSSPPPPPLPTSSVLTTFSDLGLCPPLVRTCRALGFRRPTAVQRAVIPLVLRNDDTGGEAGRHLLALAATGSGKTAAFALPILNLLSADPYGIYAVVLTPTRELAKQIREQIVALGSDLLRASCALVIGGEDASRQSWELVRDRPHFVAATPGRLAELLRGPEPRPNLAKCRFVVLDEADRLLGSAASGCGFERDVAEVLLSVRGRGTGTSNNGGPIRPPCRTLLFSATMTRSLESLEKMAGAGEGRLPLTKVIVREDGSCDNGEKKKKKKKKSDGDESEDESDDDGKGEEIARLGPRVPAGLCQEYIFMPSRVREAYLLCAVRNLLVRGGRSNKNKTEIPDGGNADGSGWNDAGGGNNDGDEDDEGGSRKFAKARSAIIFVPTCERCAHVSGILSELGMRNVALHSLLSQSRRIASLGMFKSQRVRILVATDVASRGLDVPEVDLVLNDELPRNATDYVHRVGRTARAGRRGRAISLVGERDADLVKAAEEAAGRSLEKCEDITDDMAIKLLGPVAKASRLTKMKLMDIGFDELVKKHAERKKRDKRKRIKAVKMAVKAAARVKG